MSSRRPFADRLALAYGLIARGLPPSAVHVADQLAAAGAEARVLHDRIGAVLPFLQPDRQWYRRLEVAPSDDVKAYILAAVLDCLDVCVHLRRGGPRPAFVRLPLRRIECERCVRTLRRPPPDETDRCDVCGARGVVTFVPFAGHHGPSLVVGDACAACADVLGIVREEAS